MHASKLLSGLYVVGALMVAAVNAKPDYDGVNLPVVARAEATPSTSSEYKPTRPTDESGGVFGNVDETIVTEEEEGEGEEEDKDSKSDSKSDTKKDSKTASDDDDDEESSTSKKSTKTTVRISPTDGVGRVNIIEPDIFQQPFIYKFGETITFKWNITSVKATPTALNVEAYNDANKHFYTIAANISAKETSAEWETEKDLNGEFPLMEARYTLYIYDNSAPPTAVAKAGHLQSYNSLQFGLYKAKGAVKNEDFKCIGCSGASGVRVVMGSMLIAVFSATYFVLARAA